MLPKYGSMAARRVAKTVKIHRDKSLDVRFREVHIVLFVSIIGSSRTAKVGCEYIKELTTSWMKIKALSKMHIQLGTYWSPSCGKMLTNIFPLARFPKAQYPDIATGRIVTNIMA